MDDQANEQQTTGQSKLDAAKLQALLDGVDRLNSTLSMDTLLDHILAVGQELTGSQAGSVILHDEKQDDLYFAAASGPTANDVRNIRIPLGKGKAGMVFARGLSLVENDLNDHYKAVDDKTHFVTQSMVYVPLVFASKCYGVLQLLNKQTASGAEPYDRADLELTQRLAVQATIAIRNARLFERMLASSGLYAEPEHRRDLVPLVIGEKTSALVEVATILFVDMRGFSKFCLAVSNNPTRIQTYLNQFFGALAEAVLANCGIVNKFLGDGLLALFRGPEASARAVQCAFCMRDKFSVLHRKWQDEINSDIGFLDIGVGIASDEVTIGAVGDDKVSDFTIIGNAVNLAAALEHEARDGKRVLCDNRTFRAVQSFVADVKGPYPYRMAKADTQFLIYDLRGLRSAQKAGKIFICHAHADIERIKALIIPCLERHGFDAFLAEASIEVGTKWDQAIGTAIKACDYFLVVVSKNALSSSPVSDEVHYALSLEQEKGRTWIMPVLLDQVETTLSIHWQLPRRQYKDLTTKDGLTNFEAMLQGLAATSELKSRNETSTLPG